MKAPNWFKSNEFILLLIVIVGVPVFGALSYYCYEEAIAKSWSFYCFFIIFIVLSSAAGFLLCLLFLNASSFLFNVFILPLVSLLFILFLLQSGTAESSFNNMWASGGIFYILIFIFCLWEFVIFSWYFGDEISSVRVLRSWDYFCLVVLFVLFLCDCFLVSYTGSNIRFEVERSSLPTLAQLTKDYHFYESTQVLYFLSRLIILLSISSYNIYSISYYNIRESQRFFLWFSFVLASFGFVSLFFIFHYTEDLALSLHNASSIFLEKKFPNHSKLDLRSKFFLMDKLHLSNDEKIAMLLTSIKYYAVFAKIFKFISLVMLFYSYFFLRPGGIYNLHGFGGLNTFLLMTLFFFFSSYWFFFQPFYFFRSGHFNFLLML